MKIGDVILESAPSRLYHEVLADKLPAGLENPDDIMRQAFEIAAMNMGPAKAKRMFTEIPGFENDLVSAYVTKFMPRVQRLSETQQQNLAAARELAAQIQDAMDEHYSLARPGRKDPDTLRQLDVVRKSLMAMNKELNALGFKYAPLVPGGVVMLGASPFRGTK